MKKANKELMAEMLTAIYAKDKLEAIIKLAEQSEGDTISKEELMAVLDREDDLYEDN